MINSILEILDRDLSRLAEEISAFTDESLIWKEVDGISNSSGNLCLHLCGNLRHFIGFIIGEEEYVRNREAEFALKGVPREKLLAEIAATRQSVYDALTSRKPEKLKEYYPLNVLGKMHTTEFFLIHLATHLNYHLGQINYHRRLVK